MLAGVALLLVAAGTLAVLVWASGRSRPHAEGCDCGECNRWLMRERGRTKP